MNTDKFFEEQRWSGESQIERRALQQAEKTADAALDDSRAAVDQQSARRIDHSSKGQTRRRHHLVEDRSRR